MGLLTAWLSSLDMCLNTLEQLLVEVVLVVGWAPSLEEMALSGELCIQLP